MSAIAHAGWGTPRLPRPQTRSSPATCSCKAVPDQRLLVPGTAPRLQHLPPVAFSYEKGAVRAEELADLLQQAAGFAPGQAFHCEEAPTSSSGSSGSSSDDGSVLGSTALIDPSRLRRALQRSLVCVAAFADEQHLPPHQHLAARGLLPPGEADALQERAERQQQRQRWRAWAPARPRARRVLVGFARAVGDGALVATVHDVAVLPELRGHGLGRQLLTRVVRSLDRGGIVDIGLLAPDASRGFFAACSFGRDTEESTVMTLSTEGAQQRQRQGLALRQGMAAQLKPSLRARRPDR